MRVTQLIPGTGHFYCGSCLRDYELVRGLRGLGHDLSVVPLYLPAHLEDAEHRAQEPVQMGGINMYLRQLMPRARVPRWLHGLLDRPGLLRWAAARGDMTDASAVADMTLSILRGEEGRQEAELERLIGILRDEPRPDVAAVSNAMLLGLVRRVRDELGCPVVCSLQGEAPFLDALPEPARTEAWSIIAERAADAAGFIAVSRYTADLMTRRMGLDPSRVHVVHNGIDADAFDRGDRARPATPTIGYLARMCDEKGLPTLVEAFCRMKQSGRVAGLRLRVAGVLLKPDRPLLARLRRQLREAGCAEDAEFHANVERAEKIDLLHGISVLSVPATYGESFGLYVLEAMAAGVPVVQPRHGGFPEIIERTGGGLLSAPDDPAALAETLETLLLDPELQAVLAARAVAGVREHFTTERMAREVANVYTIVTS